MARVQRNTERIKQKNHKGNNIKIVSKPSQSTVAFLEEQQHFTLSNSTCRHSTGILQNHAKVNHWVPNLTVVQRSSGSMTQNTVWHLSRPL